MGPGAKAGPQHLPFSKAQSDGDQKPTGWWGKWGQPQGSSLLPTGHKQEAGIPSVCRTWPLSPAAEGSLLSAEEAKRIGGRLASLPLPQGAPFPTLPFPALPSSLNPTPVPPQAFCSPPHQLSQQVCWGGCVRIGYLVKSKCVGINAYLAQVLKIKQETEKTPSFFLCPLLFSFPFWNN